MLYQAIYLFIMAVVLAYLEVQIEGKHGWATKLPTWRLRSRVFAFFMGGKELTGYHAGTFGGWFLILHYPFFAGTAWSWQAEAIVVAIFFLFAAVQDYLWIIINPDYGVIRRRPKDDVWWHNVWWGPFPRDYYLAIIGALAVTLPFWWGDWEQFSVLKDIGLVIGVFIIGAAITLLLVEIFRGDIEKE